MQSTSTRPSRMSPAEFSKDDSLEWDVVKCPVLVRLPDGKDIKLPTRVALVRDDTHRVLGEVSPKYEIFQNNSLLNLISPHIDEGVLNVVNQGFLNGGRKVFIQAQMADEFKAVGETHRGMLTLLNSHDGSTPLSTGVTSVRVVCQNTFAMAMQEMSHRLRHYAEIHQKALNITDTIDYVNQGMKTYIESAEALARTSATPDTVDELIKRAFQKDEQESVRSRDTIIELFRHGKGNEGKTLWDAFNGITEYLSHKSRRSENSRFSYTNFGSGSRIARRAMEYALAMA